MAMRNDQLYAKEVNIYTPETGQLCATELELVLCVEWLLEKIFAERQEGSADYAIQEVNTKNAGQLNIKNFKMSPSADAATTVTKRR